MFTKGQAVTLVKNWDDQGTVRMIHLYVHNCGKKQMILVDAKGIKYLDRGFLPREDQRGFAIVVPRPACNEDCTSLALNLGEAVVAYERKYYSRLSKNNGKGRGAGYSALIEKALAALHEPRIVEDV